VGDLTTVGTAIQRITEAIQSGVSVGAAGHRITTTVLAVELEAARLVRHPVAVAPSAVPRGGRRLAAAAPAVEALAHHPHAHHLAVAHVQVEEALARHPREHHLVVALAQVAEVLAHHRREHHLVEDHPLLQAAASVHHGLVAPARLDRAHRQVALGPPVHLLEAAHQVSEVVHVPVVVDFSEAVAVVAARPEVGSSEAALVPVEEASLVVVAVDVAPVGLVALEVAVDDRFSLCYGWRLGFNDTPQ